MENQIMTIGFIGNGKSTNRYHAPFIRRLGDKIRIKMIYARHPEKRDWDRIEGVIYTDDLQKLLGDPEIQVINSAGAGSAGSEFEKGWAQARRTDTSFVDEHFYQCPEWFIANADRYTDYEAQPKAFLGEYASKGDQWKNALAEAAFMTGMEKAPGVGLACYAPMLCNLNYVNWKPDMIYFDQSRAYGSPSYYVQKLFMNYQGEALLRTKDTLIHREKTSPRLIGKIGMQTQNAIVEISDFTYTDLQSGEEIKVPDFTLSPENRLVECLDGRAEDYSISFSFIKEWRTGEKFDRFPQLLPGFCAR